MGSIDRKRLKALESRLGVKLPPDFTATLRDREPIREGSVALVTADRVWDVRSTFGLDDRDRGDQLDRVCAIENRIGHCFTDANAGDLRDDIIEAFDVLNIDSRIDINTAVQQFLDIEITLGVPAAGGIGVR